MLFASNNGVRIYWEETGSGPPLLLIMGLGYSHEMWHRTTPLVSKHFRTILFDNRGVGQSDVPAGPYPIATMAADAAAVLDAAGVNSADVYGVSMGGMIAQEFTIRYPQRVRKLILGCTACGGPKVVRADQEVNQALMMRGNMTVEQGIELMVPYIYDAGTPRARIDEDLAIRRATYPRAEAYMYQLQGILSWESYSRLDQINAPTLVIHGETDRLVPPGNGKLIAESMAGSKLVMLPHASHLYMTDQPEASHTAVMDFLLGRKEVAVSG
jgi:pimeloyl-ACP methyl ester carboxylesterase